MGSFDEATAVTRTGESTFDVTLSQDWWAFRGPWGGYVTGVLMRALRASVPQADRTPRSLTAHFTTVAEPGAAQVAVTIERSGRTLTTLSARLTQGERLIAVALAAFSEPWPSPVELADRPMLEIPAPEELERIPYTDWQPPFLARLDRRLAVGDYPFTGGGSSEVGGWVRAAGGAAPDCVFVAALTDAWWPPVFGLISEPIGAPTIDLTIHFREPVPAAAGPDDFYLGAFRSRMVHEGFFEEDGELWSREGTLLAHSRQLGLLLPTAAATASRPA